MYINITTDYITAYVLCSKQGHRKLPKARWTSSNARGIIWGYDLGKIGLTDLPRPGWAIAHSAQNISYVLGKYVLTRHQKIHKI